MNRYNEKRSSSLLNSIFDYEMYTGYYNVDMCQETRGVETDARPSKRLHKTETEEG